MALITASQFREHYPYLESSGQDTLLDTFIARANGLMALFCGWPMTDQANFTLEQATYTLYPERHYRETRALAVGLSWVGQITSLHIDPTWAYGSDTEVDAADYLYDNRRGLLWLRPSSSRAFLSDEAPGAARAHQVVLQAGFATAPPELVAIAAAATRHLLDNRTSQGVQDQTYAGQSLTRAEAGELLPKSVKELLAPYIHLRSRVG